METGRTEVQPDSKSENDFADYGRAVLCILATVMALAGIIWAVRGLIR